MPLPKMAIFHNNQLGQSRPLSENRDYHSICVAACFFPLQTTMPEIPSHRARHHCRREQCAHIGEGRRDQLREACPQPPISLHMHNCQPSQICDVVPFGEQCGMTYTSGPKTIIVFKTWTHRLDEFAADKVGLTCGKCFGGYSPWVFSKACTSKTCQWHRARGCGVGLGELTDFFFLSPPLSFFFLQRSLWTVQSPHFSLLPKLALPPALLPNPPNPTTHPPTHPPPGSTRALVLHPSPTLSYRTEIQEVAEFLVCFHCSHSLLLLVHAPLCLTNPTRERFTYGVN